MFVGSARTPCGFGRQWIWHFVCDCHTERHSEWSGFEPTTALGLEWELLLYRWNNSVQTDRPWPTWVHTGKHISSLTPFLTLPCCEKAFNPLETSSVFVRYICFIWLNKLQHETKIAWVNKKRSRFCFGVEKVDQTKFSQRENRNATWAAFCAPLSSNSCSSGACDNRLDPCGGIVCGPLFFSELF